MAALKILFVIVVAIYQLFLVPVRQDPEVMAPVVKKAPNKPRLTIRISKDGIITQADKKITGDQLTELCKAFKLKHPDAVLEIRGAKGLPFAHVRSVIRAAAKGNMDNVVFSVWEHAGKKDVEDLVEKTIKPREDDLKMALPAPPPGKKNAIPALAPMFISVDKNGGISINKGPAKELLDNDPKQRKLPLLTERLQAFNAVAKAGGQEAVVQIWADGDAQQQRVVDVLNALAAVKISKVTFTDKVEK